MNTSLKITIHLLIFFMLIILLIPTFAHAETPAPNTYFSDPSVTEVGELWNKFGQIVHVVYYNDGRATEWLIVGTCPYYPNSPEHTVYDVSYYPDGHQEVLKDYRDTGVVDATPPDMETYAETLQEETQKLIDSGVVIDNISDTQDIVDNIHQQNIESQLENTTPDIQITTPSPTPTSTPKPTPEPTPQPTMFELIVKYDESQGTVDGAGLYEANTSIDLVAHPNEGYEVDYWVGLDDDISVFLDEDKLVEVYFKPVTIEPTPEPSDEPIATPTTDITAQITSEPISNPDVIERSTSQATLATSQKQLIFGGVVLLIVVISLILFKLMKNKNPKDK